MEIKDKVVLITGSSDGIGRETALEFAKCGANVIITYCNQKSKGEEILKECQKISKCLLVHLDVKDTDSIRKCVEEIIDEFGAIDILINNAGIIVWKDLVTQSEDEIREQIDVNLVGLINVTKKVLPYLQGQDDGVVINVSSDAGKVGYGEISVYCATKFGVRGFTQSLAEEFPKFKIRFYNVNPGMTSTKMTNYQGIAPKEVAKIILETAKENLGKKSGDDIDISEYV